MINRIISSSEIARFSSLLVKGITSTVYKMVSRHDHGYRPYDRRQSDPLQGVPLMPEVHVE